MPPQPPGQGIWFMQFVHFLRAEFVIGKGGKVLSWVSEKAKGTKMKFREMLWGISS